MTRHRTHSILRARPETSPGRPGRSLSPPGIVAEPCRCAASPAFGASRIDEIASPVLLRRVPGRALTPFAAALVALGVVTTTTVPVRAASCYDLWFERNAIFADNGYCFSSRLGRDTFGNAGCWTENPRLSGWEQRRVAAIQREERARGCKVN